MNQKNFKVFFIVLHAHLKPIQNTLQPLIYK